MVITLFQLNTEQSSKYYKFYLHQVNDKSLANEWQCGDTRKKATPNRARVNLLDRQ